METPQKGKKSRRLITTAATDKSDAMFITIENQKRSRIKTQNHKGISLITTKLHFQSEKQKLFAEKTTNQKIIQANYRKNMLNYLNKKFGEAISHMAPIQQEQKLEKNQNKARQAKIIEQITYTFQEFIHNVREENALERLTEYQIGNILKNMNFVQNLLHQRLIIIRLFSELQQKNIQNLFMFLIHFYVLNNEQNIGQNLKNLIITSLKHLFELQGITITLNKLEKFYTNGMKLGKNSLFRYMRANRQNRQTVCSVYHSLNRRKK